jgi:hypothetical protein
MKSISVGHSAQRFRTRFRRAVIGLMTPAVLLATAPSALARLDLQWDAPPDCPRRDEVQDRIRALAGSSLDRAQGLSAEGKIARVDGHFSLTLLVRYGPQTRKRVISSESCAALAGAAAVTLALLLGIDVGATGLPADDEHDAAPTQESAPDQGGQNREGTGEERRHDSVTPAATERRGEEPDQRRGGRAEQSPTASAKPPAAAASTRRWAVIVRGPFVAADAGPLPHAAVGTGLGVGMRYGLWRALLAGNLFAGQSVSAPGQDGALGAEVQRITGQLAVCRGWRSHRLELAPCVGLALERMTARGFGEGVSPQEQRAVWPALGVGAVAHWYARESLALFAGVSGYLELARPHLVIDGLGEVAQLGPVAASASAGLEWIF